MSFTLVTAAIAATLFATAGVNAEQHIIRFSNQCGYGTPQLIQGGNVLSTGEDYVSNGPFESAISYLQTGPCLFNGEECLLVEMTIGNPTVPGGGPSVDLSLIPPHAYNVETSFAFWGGTGGCNNTGADCADPTCADAFFTPDETQVQVSCQGDNVRTLL
ncbi:hypothetical protein POSPLADRAFT_1133378 [Postia placenta MAD-698-R-SB12]|uniref:Glycopeptide n=1 Tax=Postia placenta MAD-698-R-SB12 TaxID=670580 RepID=A0A1X6NCM1_9APHY|nr:hypothetical protein POSPLADRAFT_1133378 [Postia placenta MAD-698-R-SB12]OSX66378.1 hypothetical protein POSPLADRAFT_1133378 [Postia placenta MAD-698-R-SB12]